MKIVRNGVEIELTADELFSAYLEQERIYDIQDIEDNISSYLAEQEYTRLMDDRELIEKAADTLRRNQDKYCMDFENALRDTYAFIRKSLNTKVCTG